MERQYKIAGLNVSMDTFGRTEKQAIPYLTLNCNAPDILIASRREVIKIKYPQVTDDDAEYLGTGASFYRQLLNFDGIMLHASAVVVDERAYLFSANPGTGKSTHTNLWLQKFREKAYILNDDKPALRNINGKWYAFGTPWSGKHDMSVNKGVPIAGIAILERGDNNFIEPYRGKDAIFDIYCQVNRPKDMQFRISLLELLDSLVLNVPIWKLKCNMEQDAVIVSYTAMSSDNGGNLE